MIRRLALALLAALPLGGCGLHPLYADGSHGPVAKSLSAVEVGEIGGRNGWLLRNALVDRLGAGGHATPRYRLEVELDDKIEGFGISRDNAVTRERRTIRARYRLIDLQANNSVLLDATAGSDTGIDVVTSEYAVLAAEQSATEWLTEQVADQIVTRLALYASRTSAPPPK